MFPKGMTRKKLVGSVLHALGMTALVFMGKAASAGIHKNPNDHRELQSFKLTNDLSVLLISDPKADKAAAAMNIAVGSNADPEGRQGLAHFLEHMLFLGTQKYPEAGAYKTFIQSHGGKLNAYTAHENTNYYFEVLASSLEGALDIFAQFFIEPLFTEGSTERELNAIQSEHDKNVQSDIWRRFQMLKNETEEGSTFCKFSTGNNDTLIEEPKKSGWGELAD